MNKLNQRRKIEIRGIVQGVGFRPFIYRLAHRFFLVGHIGNSEAGVSIEIEGAETNIELFIRALNAEAHPLARLIEITTTALAPEDDSGFSILESTHSGPGRRTHFAGHRNLRRLRRRDVRSCESPLSVAFHQLHQLRSAIYHHAQCAL